MKRQKLEKTILLSLVLTAIQHSSVFASSAICEEPYTGSSDKYFSYSNEILIDKFASNTFNFIAASAIYAGSSGGSDHRIEMSFNKNVTVNLNDPTVLTDKPVSAVRAGRYSTMNIGGDLLSITNNVIHSNPNDNKVNSGIELTSQNSKINITAQNTEINMGGNSRGTEDGTYSTGIYNSGIKNSSGEFSAKDIKITGNMEGNFAGIDNGGVFVADNIDIQATSEKGGMYGIKNTGTAGLTFKDINIDLELKSGYSVIGVKSKSDFTADNINIGLKNGSYGLYLENGSSSKPDLSINGALNIDIITGYNDIFGAYTAGNMTVGKEVNIFIDGSNSYDVTGIYSSLTNTKDNVKMVLISPTTYSATYAVGFLGDTLLEGKQNDLFITLDKEQGKRQQGRAASMGNRITGSLGSLETGDGSETNIVIDAKPVGNTVSTAEIQGIYNSSARNSKHAAGSVVNVVIDATDMQTGTTSKSYKFGVLGILSDTKTDFEAGSQTNVILQGNAVDDTGQNGTVGISGGITAAGDVTVTVNSEGGIGIRAIASNLVGGGQKAEYSGDVIVVTNKGLAVGVTDFYEGSTSPTTGGYAGITIDPSEGKTVQLTGDVKHLTTDAASASVIDISMKNEQSFLRGASLGVNNDKSRTTDLSFDNASQWFMTADSEATTLENKNGSVIDMRAGADKLGVRDYKGTGGSFILDTDLASEVNGDKVYIKTADAGTTYVSVKDVSLVNNTQVTGVKNLLVITDDSKTAVFVGKELNNGGLWDVTPTIKKGSEALDAIGNAVGTEDQWYLTKIEKAVNDDTEVLLEGVDNSYALWRNTNDTLRKRLGDLRYRTNEMDGDGLWARYVGGKFGNGNFDGNYNLFQLGYDKADNEKSTYGFAIDRGTGKASYSSGMGKDKLLSGSLYGTWYGEKGNYTDIVARIGQFSTDIKSYGEYPDKADYKSRAYSLSVEYGKTIKISKERGTFIEPQVQLILGREGSTHYTTDRGSEVYASGINSFIGRVGLVGGQKDRDGKRDFYIKASLLHEFAAERDIYMQAANGETLAISKDYGDTWFELGLGTNIKLSKSSQFYGDIERSFGADIQKKWQINAGVRFEF